MLKYLQIAVTAFSLTACVLLVALWVRSYWRSDGAYGPRTPSRLSLFSSNCGQLSWNDYRTREFTRLGWYVPSEWSFFTQRLDYFERRRNETDFLGFRASRIVGNEIVGEFQVIVPYWFPVVSLLAFTALLWLASLRRGLGTLLNLRLDPKRLKPHFSLGTLIIVMTALAGIMTLVAAYLHE
jgi:hypothetical protein